MRSPRRARGNHEGHSQIDQARFPDVGRDELGRRLDRGQEQREVTGRGGPETELVVEDVPADRDPLIILHRMLCSQDTAYRVRVIMSVLGRASFDMAW